MERSAIFRALEPIERRCKIIKMHQENAATIQYGPRMYTVFANKDVVCVLERDGGNLSTTQFSRWLAGVLNGRKRNDAGELV